MTGKRSVRRCQSGPARPDGLARPGRLDVAAISNVRAASRVDSTEINSIETRRASRHTRRARARARSERGSGTCAHEKLDGSLIFGCADTILSPGVKPFQREIN